MKLFINRRFYSLLLLPSLLISSLAHAQVRAFLDRQQIQSYDSVQLQVEIDERTNDEPDFSVLKKDFEISQTRQSSSVRIVNGQMSATSQWTVALKPKRNGTLTIPSFSLSGQQTQPLKLQVSDQATNTSQDPSSSTQSSTQNSASQKSQNQPVFVVLDVSKNNPYVQEPILATLKIYHAVTILQGGLSDWAPSNARVQRIPDQTENSESIDGQTYQVTQVHYWITPQQSGPLLLPSIVFQGEIIPTNISSAADLLSSQFGGGSRRISDATTPQTLQVRPQPANYPANTPWLPAKRIDIQDSWTPDSQQVQVGQAITRNLNVQINGQWPSLIPSIHYPAQNHLKFYPDQSPPQDQMSLQGVAGSKTLSIAMVPTQPGNLNLPAQQLTWWNTQTDQLEHTQISAASLKVLPAPGQSMPAEPAQSTQANPATTPVTANPPTSAEVVLNKATPFWQWLAAGFGLLWLLTMLLIIWLWNRPRGHQPHAEVESAHPSLITSTAAAIQQLKTALADDDLAAIEHALIHWGQAHFQNPNLLSLSELQLQTQHAELNALLQQLSAQRYNPQPGDSENHQDFHALLPLLKTLSKNPPAKKSRNGAPLPELYPR
jgi:hypothetical protein